MLRWALQRAWAEYRKAADLAAATTEGLTALLGLYERQLDALQYRGWTTNTERQRIEINTMLNPIKAELARRAAQAVPFALAA